MHGELAVRGWQLISTHCVCLCTHCVLEIGVIVEVLLCSEVSV